MSLAFTILFLFSGLVQVAGNKNLVLSAEELKEFNGKDGKLAYIVLYGKIYDLSEFELWASGEHNDLAGNHLTESLKYAPHSAVV